MQKESNGKREVYDYIYISNCCSSESTSLSFESQLEHLGNAEILTTKKSSCPSVFFPAFLQTAVIDKLVPALFENTGIGNPITAAENRRFIKRCNKRPIAAFLKNAGIGSPKALG